MSRLRPLVALLPLTACGLEGTPVTLAQLSGSTVRVEANDTSTLLRGPVPARDSITRGVNVTFYGPFVTSKSAAANCAIVNDDLSATFDGAAMTVVSQGGYSIDDGCAPVELNLAEVTPRPGQVSSLLIRDSTAVWTIEGTDLLTNDFTLTPPTAVGEPAIITWPSAVTIDTEYVQIIDSAHTITQELGTLHGNVVTADLTAAVAGPATVTIEADRTAFATRCDGPARCDISVDAGADFSLILL